MSFHYKTADFTASSDSGPKPDTAALKRIDRLARWLDCAYRIPFTEIRFGGDALMNLAPGVGLVVSQSLSAYIVYEAYRQGAPVSMIGRMLGRLGLDTLISATPGIGLVGDIFYRANLRNVTELREHMQARNDQRATPSGFRSGGGTPFSSEASGSMSSGTGHPAVDRLQPIRPVWTTVQNT